MSKTFEEKVDELSSEVKKLEQSLGGNAKCAPKVLIVGALTPLVAWLGLYFLQPRFVQKKEGEKYERDSGKVLWWSVIITLIVWLVMYLYTMYGGKEGIVGTICSIN